MLAKYNHAKEAIGPIKYCTLSVSSRTHVDISKGHSLGKIENALFEEIT
jgi:hypothetical protein